MYIDIYLCAQHPQDHRIVVFLRLCRSSFHDVVLYLYFELYGS